MEGIKFDDFNNDSLEYLPEPTSTLSINKQDSGNCQLGTPQTLKQATLQNYGRILGLIEDYMEIQKIEKKTAADIAKMDAICNYISTEADAYCRKKSVETKSQVEKITLIQQMLRDYYQQNNHNLQSEHFKEIIEAIVNTIKTGSNGSN